MNRVSFTVLLLLVCKLSFAQYIDGPGLGVRSTERSRAKDFQKELQKSTTVYGTTAALAVSEGLSRVKYRFNLTEVAIINYLDYNSMCVDYINPFKKKKCKNRYNYLKSAHQTVLELVSIPSKHKVNQGVKEQIMTKYTQITNTIYQELELLKQRVKKETFYTRLIKGKF